MQEGVDECQTKLYREPRSLSRSSVHCSCLTINERKREKNERIANLARPAKF